MNDRVLKQKSRTTWIKHGDRNSKCFFAQLKASQTRNNISSIYTEQGGKLIEPVQVQQEFLQFFQTLLGTTTTTLPCLDIGITKDDPYLRGAPTVRFAAASD